MQTPPAPSSKAGLHAMVIGVSAYPNGVAKGLDSVPGAAISASRFARWLKNDYVNPEVELRSLSVLLSPTEAEAAALAVGGDEIETSGRATRDRIEPEVHAWAKRCDTSAEDVGVFYFSGHGSEMLLGGGLLLLEQFGITGGALAHALDLSFLVSAMSTKRAHANVFFIDACRNTIDEQARYPGQNGVQPVNAEPGAKPRRTILKMCYGAAPGKPAWTLPDDEIHQYGTVYSKCLHKSLCGAAVGLSNDGALCVTTDRLVEALAQAVEAEGASLSTTYAADIRGSTDGFGTIGQDFAFHWPESAPVELEIQLAPAVAASVSRASLWKVVRSEEATYDRPVPMNPHPARLTVASGKYRLQVEGEKPPPPFPPLQRDWMVLPPSSQWRFEIDYGAS